MFCYLVDNHYRNTGPILPYDKEFYYARSPEEAAIKNILRLALNGKLNQYKSYSVFDAIEEDKHILYGKYLFEEEIDKEQADFLSHAIALDSKDTINKIIENYGNNYKLEKEDIKHIFSIFRNNAKHS